ncbi:DUF1569 domain-containing protein [Streptomyces collinus]|uniref:DUF1569 domain-containing protein n=1 Tax=Streptomyces collinus TaxID=42684 RepID=UPI0036ABA970
MLQLLRRRQRPQSFTSVIGYPRLKPALFRATAGALAKRVFLRRGAMKHPLGATIDGAPPLDPSLPAAEAASGLADAVALFTGRTGQHAPHPAYGRCTHDEFARLHAMHLAEHLPGVCPTASSISEISGSVRIAVRLDQPTVAVGPHVARQRGARAGVSGQTREWVASEGSESSCPVSDVG